MSVKNEVAEFGSTAATLAVVGSQSNADHFT
jgi:hypothetical protein